MSVSLEEVEKLRARTGASYEACRDALERSGGDLLDAVIYLEQRGWSSPTGGSYNTQPKESTAEAIKRALTLPQAARGKKGKGEKADWRDWAREVGEMGRGLLRHSTVNQLEVWREGRLMTSVPVLILVLLVILAFWITVPLLILGLVLKCRYRFVGPDLGKESINDVMDNVSATVDGMVDQVTKEFKGKDKKP